MIWTMSSGVRSSIPKIAVAAALIAIPVGVSVPAHATPAFGGAPNTLAPAGIHPAQPPAAPATDAPEPPAPPQVPGQAPAYDWWSYAQGDGGAGGGGGGG
jgi:hypothetical protein